MPSSLLLSVIIPCYNCQDYIYECLQSVCIQIDNDVEIIIIDDGSSDKSLEQIELYKNENPTKTIHLLSQKNQGVSSARNNGIDYASGEYLAFLDGDDIWEEHFWDKIKPLLERNDIDLIEFNAKRFYDNNRNKVTPVSLVSKSAFLTVNSISDLSETFSKSEWFPWTRVYKRFLFDALRFPEGKNYEDIALIPRTYFLSRKICRITDALVLYRVRQGSITSTPTLKDIDDIIYALSIFKDLIQTKNKNEIITLAPSARLTFSLARRISTSIHGYCFFNKNQIEGIKLAMAPFASTEKFSNRMKLVFMREYCFIKRMKYKIRSCLTNIFKTA